MKNFFGISLLVGGLITSSFAADTGKQKGQADAGKRTLTLCQKDYQTEKRAFQKLLQQDQQEIKQSLKSLQLSVAAKNKMEANLARIFWQDNKKTLKRIDRALDAGSLGLCALAGSGSLLFVGKQGGKYVAKKGVKKVMQKTAQKRSLTWEELMAVSKPRPRPQGSSGLSELAITFLVPSSLFVLAGVTCTQLDKHNGSTTSCEDNAEQTWEQLQTDEPSKQCVRVVDLPAETVPVTKDEKGQYHVAGLAKIEQDYYAKKSSLETTYQKKLQAAGQDTQQQEKVIEQYLFAQARLTRNYANLLEKLNVCPAEKIDELLAQLDDYLLADEEGEEEDDLGTLEGVDRYETGLKTQPTAAASSGGNEVLEAP
ncbi:MAG: hypothetical protein J6Y94_08385 [Bacteriovoracaceae bacterium]|nr:hypothetical protein [Bacteriovoracaceae bacterium]